MSTRAVWSETLRMREDADRGNPALDRKGENMTNPETISAPLALWLAYERLGEVEEYLDRAAQAKWEYGVHPDANEALRRSVDVHEARAQIKRVADALEQEARR